MQNKFIVNKGSDLTFEFHWPDGAGGNANLNGYTVSLFDVDRELSDHITTELVDAPTGLIRTTIQWSDNFKLRRGMKFRFAIRLGELDHSTNALMVEYK